MGTAKIEKFEDMEIWQQAEVIAKKVYSITRHGEFARDFGLCDQIRRAAVSIMSNIAEGFERGTNKEFIIETNFWIYPVPPIVGTKRSEEVIDRILNLEPGNLESGI
jgi:hypothetical protein